MQTEVLALTSHTCKLTKVLSPLELTTSLFLFLSYIFWYFYYIYGVGNK